MLRIGLLASGDLGLETAIKIAAAYDVRFVLTDKRSSAIIEFCHSKKMPVLVGNPRGGVGYDFIKDLDIDVLISINYLFLIELDIINHPHLLAFNIHGSLLPKYRGRTPHVWAIINNEKSTGITAHVIDNGCDTGDIIAQIDIPIDYHMTGNDVLLQFRQAYFPLVQKVLTQLVDGTMHLEPQDNRLATYYGKRTPSDGQIDWVWQRERIYNFIRAQSAPYPGAFFFYKENKITVHRSTFSNVGYDSQIGNGTILEIDNESIHVKTPNGCLLLSSLELPKPLLFSPGITLV